MTISRLLSEANTALSAAGIEDPAFEAGLLLSWALGKQTAYIYAHPDDQVGGSMETLFRGCLNRRCHHEPFSYITGEREFMSLKFKVNPHVLIPRSDTEVLAEAALYALGVDMPFAASPMFRLNKPAAGKKRVLDIGTGSGCLAVSIARYYENAVVDAIDISEEALGVARENAETNGVASRIRFIRADFLKDGVFWDQPYDLVISNPPYIPECEKTDIALSVRDYEPHLALFAGNGGLAFFERLALQSRKLIDTGGIIAVECGYNQASAVNELFMSSGLETVVLKDLAGIARVVSARAMYKA